MFGAMSIWHWAIVLVVGILLFGGTRISNLMGDVAQGITAFRKGIKDEPPVALPKPENEK
jgi:sec-independent protein translocase protein TatA